MPVTTPKRGRLITLEGGEGAGKSTLLRGLEEHLRAQGVDLVVTREPGGTAVGEAVRGVVLDAANNDSARKPNCC
ncbi:MAG: dTMP kinase [Arachidicoccus sp.]|nr:dTMP kinase [Arachidicoccus sp.]